MYDLAVNQNIQDKVRQEINEVLKKHDGKITYESILEMTYLEKVINGKLENFNFNDIVEVCTKHPAR